MDSLNLLRLGHKVKLAFLKCEINCLEKLGNIISFQITSHVFSIKTLWINYAQIRNIFPNMVFPPVWGKKMASFRACACKATRLSLFPPGFQAHFQGSTRGSPGTGLFLQDIVVVLGKKRLEKLKQLIFEKWHHFENCQKWPPSKGYSLCKMVTLSQKLKMPKNMLKRLHKTLQLFYARNGSKKTANNRIFLRPREN